jgi:predicted phage terminase large subunit-like protein
MSGPTDLTHPERRWLFSSYALSLAIRDSLKCRRLILSPWYQRNFGHIYTLTDDQAAKLRFENDRTGYRLSTSVGGAATGEGGDRLVCDDPHNVKEADSDVIRAATLTWWDETMSTRLNDPATGAKVIVMQRVHEDDLAGHVLEQGGYEHLCLPAEYEPTSYVTGIGWLDPRTEPGELLWPQRVGAEQIADLKVRLGSYAYAGQFQQRPAPRGGGLFKRADFRVVEAAPADVQARVRYWDKAGTEGGGAYSAGVLMSRGGDGMFYVEDVVRGQWSSHQRNVIMQQTAALDGPLTTIWVEQEPGSGGKESADITVAMLAGYDVHAERPTGDKVTRARPFAAQVEAGTVALVRGAWNLPYLDELALVPHGKYWDQTDASAGAFNKLAAFESARGRVARVGQTTHQRRERIDPLRAPGGHP